MRRALSLLIFLSLLSLPAFSNTITVTGFTDALSNSDGVCTIREAVLNANFSNGALTDCAAGAGPDVINLPAGTITFSIAGMQEDAGLLSDLDVWDSVTVNGNAAGTTIDVNGKERAFDFNPTTFPTPGTARRLRCSSTTFTSRTASSSEATAADFRYNRMPALATESQPHRCRTLLFDQ